MIRRLQQEYRCLVGAYESWQADGGALMAAAVAYYVGLSLFPLLLVMISGLGLFLQYTHLGQSAEDQVLATPGEHLSPALEEHVAQAMTVVKDRSAVTGPIGLAGILLAALAAFAQFERAFNRIWNVAQPESRGLLDSLRQILIKRGIAFLMLLGMGLVIVTVFLLGMAISAVEATTETFLPVSETLWSTAQLILTLTINVLVFTLLYLWLPRVHIRWREALRGGVVAAVGWEIGRQLLSTLLVAVQDKSAYGIVGSFIAIQLWCYYAVAVVFLGAEYIQEFCRSCQGRPHAPKTTATKLESDAARFRYSGRRTTSPIR